MILIAYWINGFGEECSSRVYATFARMGEVWFVVNDWRACAPQLLPIDSITFARWESPRG